MYWLVSYASHPAEYHHNPHPMYNYPQHFEKLLLFRGFVNPHTEIQEGYNYCKQNGNPNQVHCISFTPMETLI